MCVCVFQPGLSQYFKPIVWKADLCGSGFGAFWEINVSSAEVSFSYLCCSVPLINNRSLLPCFSSWCVETDQLSPSVVVGSAGSRFHRRSGGFSLRFRLVLSGADGLLESLRGL